MAKNSHPQIGEETGRLTRERLLGLALLAAAAVSLYICYRIVTPFLPALIWAVALAVMAHPVHDWLSRHISLPGAAAFLAVAMVAVVLLGPLVWLSNEVFSEVFSGIDKIQSEASSGRWRRAVERNAKLAPALYWLEKRVNVKEEAKKLADSARERAGPILAGTISSITQLMIALFALFFFLRDRAKVLRSLRSFAPLSEKEINEVFERIRAVIHATIYGTLVVSAVQGALGGLMFWVLGLPAPVLWGTAMAVVAVIPVLGAFVIWAPAAFFLALEGDWGKATILTAWGIFVVGLIDNLLYPILVGKEMRLHTLPVFIAIVGGLFVYGAPGLIVGPVALAVTLALLDILRRRTAHGKPAELPT
jgi:predicted PurR-regulated permease PerM